MGRGVSGGVGEIRCGRAGERGEGGVERGGNGRGREGGTFCLKERATPEPQIPRALLAWIRIVLGGAAKMEPVVSVMSAIVMEWGGRGAGRVRRG